MKITTKLFFLFFILILIAENVLAPATINKITFQAEEGLTTDLPFFKYHKQNYPLNIDAHIYNVSTGYLVDNTSVSCIIYLLNSTQSHIFDSNINQAITKKHFEIIIDGGNFSDLNFYAITLHCNDSRIGGTYTAAFEVTKTGQSTTDDVFPIAIIILLPMILSFIFLVGAVSLSEEDHPIIKVFLFLLSIIPYFISMNFGLIAVIRFYNFEEMEGLIGTNVFWFSIIFGVLVSYFIIYWIAKMIKIAAEKKKEKLEY